MLKEAKRETDDRDIKKGEQAKTIEVFEHDRWEALKAMAKFLENKGYDVEMFTSMEGNDTLTVQVIAGGEQVGYFAVFERY